VVENHTPLHNLDHHWSKQEVKLAPVEVENVVQFVDWVVDDFYYSIK
jgi:hypothetical protein